MPIISTEYIYHPEYAPFTVEEQVEICCEEAEIDPCYRAGKKVQSWIGAEEDSHWPGATLDLVDQAENNAGDGTEGNPYIEIQYETRENPCGQIETQYGEEPECCDGVSEIEIDEGESFEVMAPNSSADVVWSGGRDPYTVTVRGAGFWADRELTEKTISVNDRDWATIYTDADSCGKCLVTISDGCSETTHNARSTEGEWYELGSHATHYGAYYTEWPSVFYSCTTNAYYYSTAKQVYETNGFYAIGGYGQPNLPETTVWAMEAGNVCSCSIPGADQYVKMDPFVGIFEVLRVSGTYHTVGDPQTCVHGGGGGFYRIFTRYAPITNYVVYIYEWGC